MPHHWASDLRTRIEAMCRASEHGFSRPTDLMIESDEELIPAVQSVLILYGRLLEWWPAITEKTADLATTGQRLARSI